MTTTILTARPAPAWYVVDVKLLRKFEHIITLRCLEKARGRSGSRK